MSVEHADDADADDAADAAKRNDGDAKRPDSERADDLDGEPLSSADLEPVVPSPSVSLRDLAAVSADRLELSQPGLTPPRTDPGLEPSASGSFDALDVEGPSLAGRAWHAAEALGEMGVDLTRELAHAIGPSSPYHRHDFIVIAFAVIVVILGSTVHRHLVAPSIEIFQTRGLTFERPAIWLPPEEVAPIPPRLVAADPAPPRPAGAALPYHVVYTSTIDPNVRMEVRIEARPTQWNNILAVLDLDRRTRWGEQYAASPSVVRTLGGHDWLETRFRHGFTPVPGDEPRIGHAIELATVDAERMYVVTLYGGPRRVARLAAVIAPTLRVASRTGMPMVPHSLRLQPRYPTAVAADFESTVMVMVADVIDGQLRAVGGGSGVIVARDGSILTSAHVLARGQGRLHDVFVIGRPDRPGQPPALVCAGRPDRSKLKLEVDLALIKCDADLDGRPRVAAAAARPWIPVTISKAGDPQPGQPLWVIGYPDVGGGSITVIQGAVTGYTSAGVMLGKDLIKTDAAISFGNSGGPVVDATGELIGIASISRVTTTVDGASVGSSKSGLVRPIPAASALVAIARAGWTPRTGYTSVDLAPTSIEPEAEGVSISTRVVDQANDEPIAGALVMVLREGVDPRSVEVNRLDDVVIAWGRADADGGVYLRQPVPAPGRYTVLVNADGYTPLVAEDGLILPADAPSSVVPWGTLRLAAE
jgi:S1-C subfamily serine protease